MLKFQYAINLGLALVLGVPAITLGVQANEPLEVTLKRTMQALEQLASVEQRLQDRDVSAIHAALVFTEPAIAVPAQEPEARDALLDDLRGQVERLQRDADALESVAPTDAPPALLQLLPENVEREAERHAPATTGLDDSARRLLGASALPASTAASAPVAPAPGKLEGAAVLGGKQAFEPETYAADALKLGRAYYRQGRYDQALAAFETLNKDPDALYWRARSLEKLERTADALAAYGQVLALPNAGYAGERAKEDLDFLTWRLEFDKTRARGAKQ